MISIKVAADDGSASVADVIRGIAFAAQNKDKYKIKVLNLSVASNVEQRYDIDPLAAAEREWSDFSEVIVMRCRRTIACRIATTRRSISRRTRSPRWLAVA